MNLIEHKIWLLCIAFLFFTGCNNDIIQEIDEPLSIKFEVYYTLRGDTLPDIGAKVFAYYNINQSDILDYNINNDGSLINTNKSTSIIYPDTQNKIEETGKFTLIPPKGTESLLVIIWSDFYKDRDLKSLFTEYDFYYHGADQSVKLYFMEKNHGIE
ncbi:hypothetical protein [Limibacterium fermenti]|uniref:hypothetical protein n=1 Tax=Limibacterium fermenti TaxID=3229863 RepID=UPI000E9EF07B|nr:hypothetical protein [Porphyromonadaceae bacterium]